MYMYIYIYICVCVCMYACMYVRTYVCMYVCMYVPIYVCMYACMHARMDGRMDGWNPALSPEPWKLQQINSALYRTLSLRLETAQKPHMIWSLGPKALKYESLEP